MSTTHVSSATFHRDVVQSSVPVLVDFYADWCGPCRMLAPTLDRLATEFAGRAKLLKVNVDEAPDLADRFQVASIPTLIAFLGGKVVGRAAGLVDEAGLRGSLEQLTRSSAQRFAG